MPRRPALDGLRGYAVVAVVWGHAMHRDSFAAVGVTVFFALSGFLITTLLVDETARHGGIDVRAFFLRRFWRLAPASLTLLAVIAGLTGGRGGSLWPTVAAATYLANIAAAASVPMQSLAHTWSLALEEQFYLAWPFVLGYFLRSGRRRALPWVLGTLVVVATTCRIMLVASGHGQMAARLPVARGDAILVGCILAVTWTQIPHQARRLAGVGGAGVLVLMCFAPDVEHAWWGLLTAEIAAVAVVGTSITSTPAILCSALPRTVGRISYGVYLWHFPVYYYTYQSLPPLTTFVVSLTTSLVIGAASWRWIERPLQERHRRRAAAATTERHALTLA